MRPPPARCCPCRRAWRVGRPPCAARRPAAARGHRRPPLVHGSVHVTASARSLTAARRAARHTARAARRRSAGPPPSSSARLLLPVSSHVGTHFSACRFLEGNIATPHISTVGPNPCSFWHQMYSRSPKNPSEQSLQRRSHLPFGESRGATCGTLNGKPILGAFFGAMRDVVGDRPV